MTLRFHNTATRTIEDFTPAPPSTVTMYNCGPTVYNFAHIGNLRAFIFADTIRRTLEWKGYLVHQVINITDVGHLVSDGDEGEDKMIVGAMREGKSIDEIIAMYTNAFYDDLAALNILAVKDRGMEPSFPRASHHLTEQITLIETLTQKGYTYTTSDGIYFDTSRFPQYADFAHLDIEGMHAGARVAMGEKKNPTDFALWKFSPNDGAKREQEWDSPLHIDRKGFPGWHVECSAMAMKYLGETIDIHTGGIDHIPVHHTNEIAQSECATGKTFARFWMHSAFMNVDGQKMSKSLGNTHTLKDLSAHHISPLAFRYWLLTANYRTQVNFTWEALQGAQNAYNKLVDTLRELPDGGAPLTINEGTVMVNFDTAISNDLQTSHAISQIWDILKNSSPEISPADRKATIFEFDKVLGLGLEAASRATIHVPPELQSLLDQRAHARAEKNWAESDRLRNLIFEAGYIVRDETNGQTITRRS